MKKTLIMAGILAMSMSTVFAAEEAAAPATVPAKQVENAKPAECQKPPGRPDFKRGPGPDFEKRLKLTEKQKAKAEALRQKGHEEMKPIMDQIKQKYEEIDAVKKSRIAVQAQEEKIEQIKKEIKVLKGKARELHKQNMKDFESILTKKQKKELAKMKEEGRKRFEKSHKKHPPKGSPEYRPGFGPGFGPGPAMPPKPPIED